MGRPRKSPVAVIQTAAPVATEQAKQERADARVVPLPLKDAAASDPGLLPQAMRIAGSQIQVGNWRIPDAERYFPVEPIMRTVDKYFPYAVGGPLLVDEPVDAAEVRACERKHEVIHGRLRLRYLILKPGMDDMDAHAVLEALKA